MRRALTHLLAPQLHLLLPRGRERSVYNTVFGQARKPAKMFRVGLYARVSANDQQTLPMQSRAMRGAGAAKLSARYLTISEANPGPLPPVNAAPANRPEKPWVSWPASLHTPQRSG